jgi:hypothetical protein
MASAERRKDQNRFAFTQLDSEDHAELAIWMGKANLHAMHKRRSVRPLLLAGKKILDWDSALREVNPG